MGRWAFLLILWASPVLAQWVDFVPCGLKAQTDVPFAVPEGPAPAFGKLWVWVPAVSSVLEFSRVTDKKEKCSVINVGRQRILVMGSANKVLRELGKN